jgi:hypothetical protein
MMAWEIAVGDVRRKFRLPGLHERIGQECMCYVTSSLTLEHRSDTTRTMAWAVAHGAHW